MLANWYKDSQCYDNEIKLKYMIDVSFTRVQKIENILFYFAIEMQKVWIFAGRYGNMEDNFVLFQVHGKQ